MNSEVKNFLTLANQLADTSESISVETYRHALGIIEAGDTVIEQYVASNKLMDALIKNMASEIDILRAENLSLKNK